MNSQARGEFAERWLAERLASRNVEILTRNYRCRMGEIDLVLKAQGTVIFTEVRLRQNLATARASVTAHKQQRLKRAAQHYLAHHPWQGPCRFDVVALSPQGHGFRCDWVVDAFTMS